MSIANKYFNDNEMTSEQFKIISQGIRPMINSLRVRIVLNKNVLN
jgi:hypothetical protein